MPLVETTEAIMAPALLKATLAQHAIASVAMDLNIEVLDRLHNHPRRQRCFDFFFSQTIHDDTIDDIIDLVDFCSRRICDQKPHIIALSLLVYSCQTFTAWLCLRLRQQCPTARIVIGGTGIRNFIASADLSFVDHMQNMGLIDDYIVGDGDIAFPEYCKGNYNYPGINSRHWQRVPDLNSVPWPDYDDYDFALYKDKDIPLCDSRGCVRNCEFCDIIEYWTKFQYRYADNVFAEMLWQIEKTGRSNFGFRNSLVNGNMKEFPRLLDMIIEYNQTRTGSQQISWHGYFIVRSATQHPAGLWQRIKASNGALALGVESVVQRVRNGMGKTFTNQDLDQHLEMARQYSVPLVLLIIVGYPTETLDDYEYTKQWFRDHAVYANHSVSRVVLSLASVLPNTRLARNAEQHGLQLHPKLPSIWINQNLNITNQQRVEYLLELKRICTEECGFTTLTNEQTLEHSYDH